MAGSLLAGLCLAGCASSPDKVEAQKVADSDQSEVYCQTDDSTGSRLNKTTSCTDDSSAGAAQTVRGIQGTPNIGPSGH